MTILGAAGASSGAAVFGVRAAGDKTEIVGQLVDESGKPRGAARIVRVTSGEVASLAATKTEGGFAVAWNSVVTPEGKTPSGFVAITRISDDLAKVESPITLANRKAEEPGALEVRVASGPDGDVYAAGPSEGGPCTYRSGSPEGEPCVGNGWSVWRVDRGGKSQVLSHRNLDASAPTATFLARIDGQLVASAEGMRGGLVSDVVAGEPASLLDARKAHPACGTAVHRLAVDDRVVTYCETGYCPGAPEKECARVRLSKRGTSQTKEDQDGFTAMTKLEHTCVGDSPTLRLHWKGGSIDVPPAARGAFTGAILLVRTREGYERERCQAGKVVTAPFAL